MKVIQGDLVKFAKNGEFDVIVHGCNCECAMAGGIAKQIKKAFPRAYEADCNTASGDANKMGSISFARVNLNNEKLLVIVNGYTQLMAGGNVNYDALRKVMRQVKQNFYGLRIGYPMIGSGLAGGEWALIEKIIKEELNGEDHTLVEFAQTNSNPNKRQKMDCGTRPTRVQPSHEEKATLQANNPGLLDFIVEKICTKKFTHLDVNEVKEMISEFVLEQEIPQDLIPKQKKSPFMVKHGLYPRWIEEIAPFVLVKLNEKYGRKLLDSGDNQVCSRKT